MPSVRPGLPFAVALDAAHKVSRYRYFVTGASDTALVSHIAIRGSPGRLRAKTVHVLGIGAVLLCTRVCLAAEAPVEKETVQ